jgi:serine/threonine protein phosphatase PrpC
LSGATVVAVFIYNERIICFNVGDSRAILINDDHNVFRAQQISFDHKPDRAD